jgi:acetolactate synthase-1/2/3 large subunit
LKLDLKVHSEAKRFLELLLQRLFGTPLDTRAWISRCQKWKADFPAVPPECREQEHWLNSYVFVDVLSEVLGRDDVIVTDMGLAFQATHQALRVKRGQRFFTNGGFAPMGWGLPAAIGACLAHQKRRVVCIAGDGGLQMNLQELATVMHHRLPVKLFVFNNGGYLTIKQSQELAFSGRVMGCNPETGLGFPDLEPLAKAYRMEFLRIDSKVNLEKRLRKIMESPGPVICELMQDPDQPQIPKAIPRRNAEGKALPTAFEDLYPFLPPEEVKANCPPAK